MDRKPRQINGITRRHLIQGATVGAAALAAERAGARSIGRSSRHPNVLLITTDQEQPWRRLPHRLGLKNHERLMARATHFENWSVNSLPCGPSRSNLYTGQHVQHTKIADKPGFPPWGYSLDPEIATLCTLFKSFGYRTAYKGKWHLSIIKPDAAGDHSAGLRPFGFDEYQKGPEAYGLAHDGYDHDPEIALDAAQWLMRQDRHASDPWLLCVNFLNPHDIMFFDATGEMNETLLPVRGAVVKLEDAPNAPPYGRGPRIGLPENFRRVPPFEVPAHRIFAEDNELFLGRIDDNDQKAWATFVNYYADCLRDVDRHLGLVLDALDRSGHADNTIVAFTADHGELAGAHGYRQKGPFIYTENLGVPLIVRHPDQRSGGSDAPALGTAVDLAPTLLGLAGVDTDRDLRSRFPRLVGHDLSEVVFDPRSRGRRAERAGGALHVYSALYTGSPNVRRKRSALSLETDPVKRAQMATVPPYFVEFENRSFYRGLSDGRYCFARYFSPRDHHRPEDWANLVGRNDLELYDTEADPLQQRNLARDAAEHRELILRLNGLLNRLIDQEVGVDDGRHMPGSAFQWKV